MTSAHLVDEGSELVVESFDLLLLLLPNSLDGGVDLQVEGSQEALVDSDLLDTPRGADRKAPSQPSSIPKPTADPKSIACPAPKATPEVAATASHRDPLGATQVVEAATSKGSPLSADPPQSSTGSSGPDCGDGTEARSTMCWHDG